MKLKIKKALSMLLALVLLVSLSASHVLAADMQDGENPNLAAEADNVEIEGESPMGDLLASTIDKEIARTNQDNCILGLSVTGQEADVTYSVTVPADLAVAIYDENKEQMLAFGKVSVSEAESTISVPIEGTIPQYFVATAYLLEQEGHAPLCDPYVTELYTQPMQEIEDKTVNDFQDERVLNLDEQTDTNFAVYSADTKVIGNSAQTSPVTENADGIYTIQNASEDFTSLKPGDSFACTGENGEALVLKVKDIQIDGGTVTITEDKNVQLEEVFDYVKIEGGIQPSEAQLETETQQAGFGPIDVEKEPSVTKSFDWKKKLGSGSATAQLSAAGSITVTAYIKIYLALKSQHVEFTLTTKATFDCTAEGKISKQSVPLLGEEVNLSPVLGVKVLLTPTLVFEASGEVTFQAELVTVLGFSCENGKGLVNKSSKPKLTKCDFHTEATIYLGLGLAPGVHVKIINKELGRVDLYAQVGTQIHGEMDVSGTEKPKGDAVHQCKACIDGEAHGDWQVSGGYDLPFIGENEKEWPKLSAKLTDFYYSFDKKKFGWTKCPNYAYKITLTVTGADGAAVADAAVQGTGREDDPVTDASGKAEFYLVKGAYTLKVRKSGQIGTQEVQVEDKAKKVKMQLEGQEIVASGTCGADLVWQLDEGGLLTISGTGDMTSWNNANDVPWAAHRGRIVLAALELGVTSIGSHALDGCTNLTSVEIPDGVTDISNHAFWGCTNLASVEIPGSVTFIGESAFQNCAGLIELKIPDSVTILDRFAFNNCTGLLKVEIPGTITTISEGAFQGCTGLTGLEIPEGVRYIDKNAFQGCTGMLTLKTPGSVESIAEKAFVDCTCLLSADIKSGQIDSNAFGACRSMTILNLGGGVKGIGTGAFYGCSSLKRVDIPNGVNMIGYGAFEKCSNLSNVTFGTGLNMIDVRAFADCTRLGSIVIPSNVTEIRSAAFTCCTNLTSVTLGSGLTGISDRVFEGCIRLNDLVIPSNIEEIGGFAFSGCTSLISVTLSEGLKRIWEGAFHDCRLISVTFPASLEKIYGHHNMLGGEEKGAFSNCTYLSSIRFNGNAPNMDGKNIFGGVVATVYHPDNDSWSRVQWDEGWRQCGAIKLTWVPISSSVAQSSQLEPDASSFFLESQPTEENPNQTIIGSDAPTANAFTPISAHAAHTDNKKQTARFTGLQPGRSYVFLALKDATSADLLAAANLLYISQGNADQSGELTFTYVPRTNDMAVTKVYGPGLGEGDVLAPGAAPGSSQSPKGIAACTVTLSQTSYVYNGKSRKPAVTVKDGATALKAGTDYTVSYKNNVHAGKASVTVTGKGGYTGTKTATFTIKKASGGITASNVTKKASGKAQSFSIGARAAGGAKLSYRSSQKAVIVSGGGKVTIAKNFIGKAVITITAAATADYDQAERKITVTVKSSSVKKPAKPQMISVENLRGGKIKVTWKKGTGVTGYRIEASTDKKFKKGVRRLDVKGAKQTSKTISGMKKGQKYYVRIRAYRKASGKTVYSDWSKTWQVTVKK